MSLAEMIAALVAQSGSAPTAQVAGAVVLNVVVGVLSSATVTLAARADEEERRKLEKLKAQLDNPRSRIGRALSKAVADLGYSADGPDPRERIAGDAGVHDMLLAFMANPSEDSLFVRELTSELLAAGQCRDAEERAKLEADVPRLALALAGAFEAQPASSLLLVHRKLDGLGRDHREIRSDHVGQDAALGRVEKHTERVPQLIEALTASSEALAKRISRKEPANVKINIINVYDERELHTVESGKPTDSDRLNRDRRRVVEPIRQVTACSHGASGEALLDPRCATPEEEVAAMREAVACLEAALSIYRRDEHPADSGSTQRKLGNAHASLPSASAEARAANVRRTVACCEEALSVYDKDQYPVHYAMTQSDLGIALRALPSATTEERAANVRRAVSCFEEALTVYCRDEYPVEYAATQNNLGNALTRLSNTSAEERRQNLRRAITCYEKALTVCRKDELPVRYATTQNNLGNTLREPPSSSPEERTGNIHRAIACFEEALTVRRKDEYPVDYGMTQNNLGLTLLELPRATAEERTDNIRRAVACFAEALSVYRKDEYPVAYARTAANLGLALATLDPPRGLAYLEDAYTLRQFLPDQGQRVEDTIRRLKGEVEG